MKRRVVPIVAWLAATVVSVLLATAAVGNVGNWGTDQPTALQATTVGVITVAPSPTPAPTPDGVASTTAVLPTAVPSTPAPPASATTAAPASASTTAAPTSTTATPQPPATTQPPAPTTTLPSTTTTSTVVPPSEEYFESRQLIGGWVQLRINGDDVHLEAAVAEPGFTIDLEHNGPEKVEVEFKSESHDSKLTARFHNGELDIRTEEESEDDD